MKIRRYIMNLVCRSGGKSILLPTVQELCDRFDVSRPTVCKAMKELTQQGYVIAKRGVGSFSNSSQASSELQMRALVGLLLGDGMGIYLARYYGIILGEMIKQLVAAPVIVQQITLGSIIPETVQKEILGEQLNLLVWISGRAEQVAALRAAGLPVLSILGETEQLPGTLRLGYEAWGYHCGNLLIEEGRKCPVFLQDDRANAALYKGIRRAYSEAGLPLYPALSFEESFGVLPKLGELIRGGVPVDAVCNPMLGCNQLTDFLMGLDPSMPKKCAIVQCTLSDRHPAGFHEICFDIPAEEVASKTVSMVQHALHENGGYAPAEEISLATVIR